MVNFNGIVVSCLCDHRVYSHSFRHPNQTNTKSTRKNVTAISANAMAVKHVFTSKRRVLAANIKLASARVIYATVGSDR